MWSAENGMQSVFCRFSTPLALVDEPEKFRLVGLVAHHRWIKLCSYVCFWTLNFIARCHCFFFQIYVFFVTIKAYEQTIAIKLTWFLLSTGPSLTGSLGLAERLSAFRTVDPEFDSESDQAND